MKRGLVGEPAMGNEGSGEENSVGDLERRMGLGLPELVSRHGIVLAPNGRPWESKAVINGPIFRLEDSIGLLYRAFGEDETCKWRREGTSSFGLATSQDELHFERASDEPVFKPEGDDEKHGVEDPRVIFIDDRFYVPYTAVKRIEGKKSVEARVSLASTTDFRNFKRYGVILRDNEDVSNKDAALFPEKIGGSYIMLHRRDGVNIWMAYSDDLINWYGHRIIMKPKLWWEKLKIGACFSPIKTEEGWELYYHGVDKDNVYRVGVALLNLEDPSKEIVRLGPIFQPETHYEKIGLVNNVVFPCGAIPQKDNLNPCGAIPQNYNLKISYGAGDTVTALAVVNRNRLNQKLERALAFA
ncbi:glycosidase [Candidatus Woesearchaeota archaeon B3_Woes]|nr:MAG: glycosidase [Candidatus Woesearchaeota archaeon B3_Woes]